MYIAIVNVKKKKKKRDGCLPYKNARRIIVTGYRFFLPRRGNKVSRGIVRRSVLARYST